VIFLRIRDGRVWILFRFEGLAEPHSSSPYVHIGLSIVLYMTNLFSSKRCDLVSSSLSSSLYLLLDYT
jgi:hypothetical protein